MCIAANRDEEKVLQIKTVTVWVQWLDWMENYTLGLVPHIHNFFYAGGKANFMPVIDMEELYFIAVFSLYAGFTASGSLCHTSR